MTNSTLASAKGIFEIEQQDDTIIVVPTSDLRELDFQRIVAGGENIFDLLKGSDTKNVVLDFHKTDYYGSAALGWFVKLWKRVRGRDGRMAFCNLSEHEKEILQFTKLDHLWPICSSRQEAVDVVRGEAASNRRIGVDLPPTTGTVGSGQVAV